MKKLLLATVSMLALSTAARSADLPAKARTYAPDSYPIWTGGYIGIQGGVTRHDASFTDFNFGVLTIEGNKTGGTFGGLLGYNWQRGSFVYGLEGDWNWVGAKTASDLGLSNAKSSFDVDWVATVRGRAGLAVDATLIYLTGGIAFGHVKDSLRFSTGPTSYSTLRKTAPRSVGSRAPASSICSARIGPHAPNSATSIWEQQPASRVGRTLMWTAPNLATEASSATH